MTTRKMGFNIDDYSIKISEFKNFTDQELEGKIDEKMRREMPQRLELELFLGEYWRRKNIRIARRMEYYTLVVTICTIVILFATILDLSLVQWVSSLLGYSD